MTDIALEIRLQDYLDALAWQESALIRLKQAEKAVAEAAEAYDLERERSKRRLQLPGVPVDN